MNTVENDEYTIDIADPSTGNAVVITAKLFSDGVCYVCDDETGWWYEIETDPEFCDYTYEDMVTEATGVMPDAWKPLVDLVLTNIYWDREINR